MYPPFDESIGGESTSAAFRRSTSAPCPPSFGKSSSSSFGAIGLKLELVPQGRGSGQSITDECQIARAPPSRRQPGERSGKVWQDFEGSTDPLAPKRVLVQPGDQRETGFDRRAFGQRC